jgi:ubiquinone biosynthesis protein UbiJ
MMLSQSALMGIESLINKALAYDPATQAKLAKLSGHVLAIQVTSPEFTVFVMPDMDGINLMSAWDGDVDARLAGSALALARLPFEDLVSLRESGVSLLGKTQLVADLSEIIKTLDIDWEEMISRLTGDVVGHQVANVIRGQVNWWRDRGRSGKRLTHEFLTQEINLLPSRLELAEYYREVDALRFAVDRVQAKLHLLSTTIKLPS